MALCICITLKPKRRVLQKFETTYIDISNNEAVEYKTKAMSISELYRKKLMLA